MIRRFIILIAVVLLPSLASAQFYVTGDDPGMAKWYSIETENFKVIYPEGADSLAKIYARKIEAIRKPVAVSGGYFSGQGDGKKMPVVMHAYNDSNGSVAWAPRRMDLFTVPSAYNPEPLPWSTMLSIHESRHITQMQFGMTGNLKFGNYIFGEMWNIVASLAYPGLSNIEGESVIAETVWSKSGRGRTADFLNYFWVGFDNGDFRKWDKWRFVSQKKYAPSYYATGYLTMGGIRYLYDQPELLAEVYRLASRQPYKFWAFKETVKKLTGKKFDDAFLEVCDTMYTLWKADAEKRKPYISSEVVSPATRMYTDYTENLIVGNDIYTVKEGHVNTPTLVRLDSAGRERRVSSYAYSVSRPAYSPDNQRLYWSETKPDKRWDLKTLSVIRYMDMKTGKKKTLKNPDLLHNPAPAASGAKVATVKYDIDGRSSIVIIDGNKGSTLESFFAPDSLQLIEPVWLGEDIYASAISDNGYGVYGLKGGVWSTVLAPQPVMIKDLGVHGAELIFTCDRTGVNELYHLSPAEGKLTQKTSTRYGSEDFRYSEDGSYLYFTSQTLSGKRIFKTPADSLIAKAADFTKLHYYPIAEKLTAQEKERAAQLGIDLEKVKNGLYDESIPVSEPRRYHKFPNMFYIHSWAPLYVSPKNIMSMSFGNYWEAASLGATAIMQNRLSTFRGEFGYSAHPDPYEEGPWRHSGHVKFTYSGLYPVFEVALDFNDRAARRYNSYATLMPEGGTSLEISSKALTVPHIEGRISTYIPFRFSSGGWYKGVTPTVSYHIGNDIFDNGTVVMDGENHIYTGKDGELHEGLNGTFLYKKEGKVAYRHRLSGSLQAYIQQSTPNSCVYPRWGLVVEAGAGGNLESSGIISPMGYGYIQGYLPGFTREQGLKLSALSQVKLNDSAPFGQAYVSTLPRGLSKSGALTQWISLRHPAITKLSADYAIPIYPGELSIGGKWFAIKRFVLIPHFDYTFFGGKNLWSAGAQLNLDLHAIITIEYPVSFGVSASYNGGSAFEQLATDSRIDLNRFYIGPKFNVSF